MNPFSVTYLGTAAAEGLPAVFCNCPTCVAARKSGGRNVRTRSQILICDDLLIDFPMDTYMHALHNGLDLSRVKHVFITHSHMDHCYAQDFTMHGAPYAHDMTEPNVHLYGNADVLAVFAEQTRREMHADIAPTVRLHRLSPYERTQADAYTVTALPARHTVGEDCLTYLVEKHGKRFLQLNDTGILPDDVYDRLRDMTGHIDAVSFDCTYGYYRRGEGGRHMGAPDAADERDKLAARGLVDADTQYILTHFSHNGGLSHDELCEKVRPLGFLVAYDGMKIEL